MKNMKKLLQKAMVFTLSAAMLVGTPMTASAAGLVGLYSVSDGTGQVGEDADPSHTGTVTNTYTDTNTGVLKDNYLRIAGIALDKTHVDAEKGVKDTLTATVLVDGMDENSIVDRDLVKGLAGKIKWQVLYADNKTVKNGVAANQVLSISASADKRTEVTLNPRQGTVIGEDMIVRATIEGGYGAVYNEETGEKEIVKLTDNAMDDYTAEATVFIKEYTEKLELKGYDSEQYVKHTYDLSKYIVRTPETANDTITWTSSDTKTATVTAAGVVTFKKATSKDAEDNDIPVVITAVSERGKTAEADFVVGKGTPATKVEIWAQDSEGNSKKVTKLSAIDLADDVETNVDVKMYAKVEAVVDAKGKPVADLTAAKKNGEKYATKKVEIANGDTYFAPTSDKKGAESVVLEVTDDIAWTTSKATIATVDGDNSSAKITATEKALGTVNITAKASSGKSAKVSVPVKASLTELEIGNVPTTTLYSGQSVTLTANRFHPLNKDAVKWSIKKVEYDKNGQKKTKANPNATIKNGVLTIKPKLDADYLYVTVELVSKATKKNDENVKVPVVEADSVTISLAQSNIDGFSIREDSKTGTEIARFETTYRPNGKVKASKQTVKNKTTNISVPKGRTYVAQILKENEAASDVGANTLLWKSSNEKVAKVVANGDGTAKITAIAKGNATVTVSGVREKKAIKATFKVAVKQPTTSLTMNKTLVVLKNTNNNLSASFSVKQNKNAKETITWSVDPDEGESKASITNKGKVTIKKGNYKAGDVFTVTAKSESGVTAKATIKVVTPSTGVRVVDTEGKPFTYDAKKGKTDKKAVNNATTLGLGGSVELVPQVNVTKNAPAEGWVAAGSDDGKVADVEYSVNKKGIVQIIGNTVYRVGNGSVKITVKSTDGKKYTLTIDDESKKYVAPAPSDEK